MQSVFTAMKKIIDAGMFKPGGSGTQFTAADITLPAGATLVSDPETLLVNVIEAPSESDLEEDEEAAPQGEAAEDAAKAAEEG